MSINIKKIIISSTLVFFVMLGGIYVHYTNEPEPFVADFSQISHDRKKSTNYPIMEQPVSLTELLVHISDLTLYSSLLDGFSQDFVLELDENNKHFMSIVDILSKYILVPVDSIKFPDHGGTYYTDGSFKPSIAFMNMDMLPNENGFAVSEYILMTFKGNDKNNGNLASLDVYQSGMVVVGYFDASVDNGIREVPYILYDDSYVLILELSHYILDNDDLMY